MGRRSTLPAGSEIDRATGKRRTGYRRKDGSFVPRAKVEKEMHAQKALCAIFNVSDVCYTAIPNGGGRFRRFGSGMGRTEGVMQGFPDMLLFARLTYRQITQGMSGPPTLEREGYAIPDLSSEAETVSGVALELKKQGAGFAVVRPEQRDWLERLRQRGWVIVVGYGRHDALGKLIRVGVTFKLPDPMTWAQMRRAEVKTIGIKLRCPRCLRVDKAFCLGACWGCGYCLRSWEPHADDANL